MSLGDIPGIVPPTVAGHGNELVLANLGKHRFWIVTGRSHLYEGHSALQVVAVVRLLGALGVENICLSNAAGSLKKEFSPGMILLISDHLNLTGQNCLSGESELGPEKFLPMANAYDPQLRAQLATELGLKEGIYAGLLGPNYETNAECRMLAHLGADLVGMSTIQEAISARMLKMRILGYH